ncbi:MAG: hypothetical protein WDN31_00715 [Hyphomicrobium sp.]
MRKVAIARDRGIELDIHDGVKAGDQVILNPAVELRDGDRVDVRPAATGPT